MVIEKTVVPFRDLLLVSYQFIPRIDIFLQHWKGFTQLFGHLVGC